MVVAHRAAFAHDAFDGWETCANSCVQFVDRRMPTNDVQAPGRPPRSRWQIFVVDGHVQFVERRMATNDVQAPTPRRHPRSHLQIFVVHGHGAPNQNNLNKLCGGG